MIRRVKAVTVRDGELSVEEHPDPEPGLGEVLIKVHGAGLNGADLSFVPGRELGDVLAAAERHRPAVLVVDSVHTLRDGSSTGLDARSLFRLGCDSCNSDHARCISVAPITTRLASSSSHRS